MTKDKAAKILNVQESRIKHFVAKDPFNPWTLEGYISMSESMYGCMVITKIDNYLTEQVIVGTPKQKYPFNRVGKFIFPTANCIEIYEKYDGTNILAYSYRIKGKDYITYKTRLNPILNTSRWGDFCNMWKEMLVKYPKLEQFIIEHVLNGINLSFELYGSKNKHLIEYNVPLDTVLLFGIRNDIENRVIVDPKYIPNNYNIPYARLETRAESPKDLESWYNKFRKVQEALNKTTEDGYIIGSEGFVWYLEDINDVVHQYKCKPPSVEEIHWSSHGINKNSIMTTIINAYEDNDEVTYEIVKELLLEEYEEKMIEVNKAQILEIMRKVIADLDFRDRVINTYINIPKQPNFRTQRIDTMRELSKNFEKKEMRKVFNVLNNFCEVTNEL